MATAKKVKEVATFFIQGLFVRFTFIRLYKGKTGASYNEAETAFKSQLSAGRILLDRKSGLCGDIAVYKFKN